MTVFASADVIVPKDFHEITRLRLREISEVTAKPKLVKQSRCSRAVRVPASPHSFAVALVANDELIQGSVIELQLAAVTQLLDCFDEHQIRRPGAEADIWLRWDDEKFARFKMGGGLQFDRGEVRDGIFAAARHLARLLEN